MLHKNEKPKTSGNCLCFRSLFIFNCQKQSLCTLDLAGAQASGANVHMTRSSLHNRFYTLYVRLPCSVRPSVGVRNLDAKRDTLAAKIALCQLLHLQSSQNHALDRAKRRLYIIAKKSQECKGKIEKMQKNFPFGDFPEFARKKRKNGCQTYRKPL